eukprot:COSAG06_NODE_64141_length_260_cov_0.689441_1_plen_77_part_01
MHTALRPAGRAANAAYVRLDPGTSAAMKAIPNESHGFGDVFAASDHRPQPISPLADADVQAFIRDGFLAVKPSTLDE